MKNKKLIQVYNNILYVENESDGGNTGDRSENGGGGGGGKSGGRGQNGGDGIGNGGGNDGGNGGGGGKGGSRGGIVKDGSVKSGGGEEIMNSKIKIIDNKKSEKSKFISKKIIQKIKIQIIII